MLWDQALGTDYRQAFAGQGIGPVGGSGDFAAPTGSPGMSGGGTAIDALSRGALQGAGGFLSQAMQPQVRGTEAIQGAFGTLGQQFDPFGAAQTQFERLESNLVCLLKVG
jgi:hypothetical protein